MHCKRPQRTHHTNNNATLQRIRLSYSEYDVAQCTKTWSMCIFMKRAQEKLLAIFKNSTIRCAMKTTKWHLDVYWFVFFSSFSSADVVTGLFWALSLSIGIERKYFFSSFYHSHSDPGKCSFVCIHFIRTSTHGIISSALLTLQLQSGPAKCFPFARYLYVEVLCGYKTQKINKMTRVLQICVQLSAVKDSIGANALFKLCVRMLKRSCKKNKRQSQEQQHVTHFFLLFRHVNRFAWYKGRQVWYVL